MAGISVLPAHSRARVDAMTQPVIEASIKQHLAPTKPSQKKSKMINSDSDSNMVIAGMHQTIDKGIG